MKKSKEQVRLYMSNIRKLLVIRHDMPLREMQRQLEENGKHLDLDYINFLRAKVMRERVRRMDQKALYYALASFEDVMSEIIQQLWPIAMSNVASRKERIMALGQIRKTYEVAFDKLFDAGVFKRHLGELELKLRNAPLPDEAREEIVTTV